MEITWYGHSCFKLTERGVATVVTDPYDPHHTGLAALNLLADIVTISSSFPGHNHLPAIKGDPRVITGPGEYEVGSVFITAIQTESKREAEDFRNTLYVFDINTLTVAHLGNLNRVPTQSETEAMGTVNVALVPVGGGRSLNAARAAEVISLLEPNIVIPMHYDFNGTAAHLEPLSKFLKEMGLTDIQAQPSLKINQSSLPEETQVIVLDYQRG
jgi:L-ascorbate metabolism protein UlaG (beta-lactamase superfamily)